MQDRRYKQEGTLYSDTYFKGTIVMNQTDGPVNGAEKINAGACPIRDVLDRFGDKWSILVLVKLEESDTMRFNELNRAIGDISQKMLTVTLRSLEADGLVSRRIYPEIPPRVEYRLTEMGKSLLPHVSALKDWSLAHMPAIMETRRRFARRQTA